MDRDLILFLLMAGLTIGQAGRYRYDYNDYNDYYGDDYDYRPYHSREHGRRHFGRYPTAPLKHKPRRIQNFGLSFGGKGNYKLSGSAQGNANLLGQKAAFKGSSAQEGYGEAGARWDSKAISAGGKAASRGSSTGEVMGDTWIGGGSSKLTGAHDVGGETGITWDNGDNDPGMSKKSYLANYNG